MKLYVKVFARRERVVTNTTLIWEVQISVSSKPDMDFGDAFWMGVDDGQAKQLTPGRLFVFDNAYPRP